MIAVSTSSSKHAGKHSRSCQGLGLTRSPCHMTAPKPLQYVEGIDALWESLSQTPLNGICGLLDIVSHSRSLSLR